MKNSKYLFLVIVLLITFSMLLFITCKPTTVEDEEKKWTASNLINYGVDWDSYSFWFNNFEEYNTSDLTVPWSLIGTWYDATIDWDGKENFIGQWGYISSYQWFSSTVPVTMHNPDGSTDSTKYLRLSQHHGDNNPANNQLVNIPGQSDLSGDFSKVRYLIFWAKHNNATTLGEPAAGDNYRMFVKSDNGWSQGWSNVLGVKDKNANSSYGITGQWQRFCIKLSDTDYNDGTAEWPDAYNPVDIDSITNFAIGIWNAWPARSILIDDIYFAANRYDPAPGVSELYPEASADLTWYDDDE